MVFTKWIKHYWPWELGSSLILSIVGFASATAFACNPADGTPAPWTSCGFSCCANSNGTTTSQPSQYQAPVTTTSTTPNLGTSSSSQSLTATDAWKPASGYQQNITSQISTSTSGFTQDATNEAGGYTYNGCASQGAVTAYNAASGESYCRPAREGCPAGEVQINNDGVCQGTGSDNAGTFAQWTFSACVNGHQTEYTHNVNTGAVVDQNTISCVAGSNTSPTQSSGSSSSSTSTTTACYAPSASSSSQPAGSSFAPTGCAGSCSASGCSSTGVETGITTAYTRHCTTSYSCPGPTAHTSCSTSSTSYASTQRSSTQCQQTQVLLDHCMPNEPGYREAEYCLTFNGSPTNCSAPFGVYDPTNCPVPVGVGSGS
ncbi:hypothetical protein [Sulfobacillus thermosulfidooxidans]|uniref:hypothetical protein n=1 Tax=Sulfobacillus thermosulfidooxidans TaxID=28034 RepID=UPI000B2F9E66|nr:hypothetical protein [Sulfobacillus thermosulfidooxidans]